MADILKLNVKDGGEIYVPKFAITYFAKNPEGDGSLICFSAPNYEDNNHIIVIESTEEIIAGYEK
jgi:hypothetical protein